MSREQDVFVLAEHALQQVIGQITEDKWELDATSIPHWGDQKMTLRDIVNRHVYDDAWVPDTLSGNTIAEVGTTYDGDLLGDNPHAAFATVMDKAIEAVKGLGEEDLSKPAHLSYGDFPIREYLEHISVFRGFRAYTIAKFLGIDATLPDDLVDGLWDISIPSIDFWREIGVFGPEVAVPDDADKQTKLLGITGYYQA